MKRDRVVSRLLFWTAGALMAITIGIKPAYGATVAWTATGTNDWFGTNNWSTTNVPAAGDDVYITNASVNVLLTNATAELSSFTISNTATLIFSNWDTLLNATNVNILRNATLTCAGPLTNNAMTNRVYVACSNNLTIANGAQINLNGKGFFGGYYTVGGYGPGGAVANTQHGASHGGMGGGSSSPSSSPKSVYDQPDSPNLAGSGGCWWNGPTCHGGGAIRVVATGTATVNGAVTANATDSGDNSWGGGSGGSVWITCSRIIGTGTVSAAGGKGGSPNGYGGHGGGGRIAIVYDTSAQQGTCGVSFVARAGIGNPSGPPGDIGTLWFPDTQLFPTNPGTSQFVGQVISGAGAYNFDSFMLNGGSVRFLTSNQVLRITNDLLVTAGGTLDIGGDSWQWNAGYGFMRFATNSPTVLVGGNFLIGSGAVVNIYSVNTNATQPTGALVRVSGLLAVTNGSAIYPWSHATNGGSPFITASNILVDSNSTINADYKGCGSYYMTIGSSQRGWGSGGGLARQGNVTYGASHGGLAAANSLAVYGSSNAPIDPGSGGGANNGTVSGFGGGVICLQAPSGSVTINGTLSANGRGYTSGQCLSGGSGGSIYITCRSFLGNGTLRASGGNGGGDGTYNGYGSAGGRIAVWRRYHSFTGSASATGGCYNTSSSPFAGDGTIVWGQLPIPGTIFRFH